MMIIWKKFIWDKPFEIFETLYTIMKFPFNLVCKSISKKPVIFQHINNHP